MKKKSFFAAGISVILALSMLVVSGCTSKKETETTKPVNTSTETVYDQTEKISDTTHSENTQVQSESVTETTTAAAEESAATSSSSASPSTTEEIVELFNKSANRIKKEAVKVTKNYENRIVDEDKLVVPDAIESAARSLMKTFMKDDTEPIVYDTKEDIRENYIVPGQDYVSRLKAKDVEKAVCTDNGDEYEIYILLKTEKNPVTGEGVGSVCDIIEAHEVAEKVSFVEEFSTEYNKCEVRVTIDKATGRVTHAIYSTSLILDMKVNLFGTHRGSAGLTFVKDFTITY